MKNAILILALLCSTPLSGQISIKGNITDGRQDLPFATVRLHHADSSLVKGVLTDSTGNFAFEKIKPGAYLISASMVGYDAYFSDRLLAAGDNIVVGEITLQETPIELNEVIVKEDKQLFDQRTDRLVIHTEKSITSAGNTILEILQKSPGIVINRQDNSIRMNGRSGVRVMINDKTMEVPADVVVQMLDGMNASNVEKIELIAAPPSNYDAEGNAGIIRIITKGNPDSGTNGSVGVTIGARWAENLGANINVNHRSRKFACFLDYSLAKSHNLHLLQMHWQYADNGFVQTVENQSHRENITLRQNFNAGVEWKLSEHTAVNLSLAGYRNSWNLNAITNDTTRVATDDAVFTQMNIAESNIWQSATGSIGVKTKIDGKSGITFALDYLRYHNNNPSAYDNKISYEQPASNEVSKITLEKTTPIRFLVGKADYRLKVSSVLEGEAGIKAVASTLDNHVLVQRGSNDSWITDSLFTSRSTLTERVYAAYVSAKWQRRQWHLSGGIRYEHTGTSISSPVQHDLVSRKYDYLFPTLTVRKNLGAEKDFQFSYSRRITRPTYNDIAPYVFFWSPHTFSAGNAGLYPAVGDAVLAGYHVKAWTLSLQFSHVRNEINSLQPEVDKVNKTLTFRSQNLQYLNTLALTNSYSISFAPWWEFQSSLTARYQVARTSNLANNAAISLCGLSIDAVNQLRLPANFSIEISGTYQSGSLSGISRYLPAGSFNAGIQKKFGEKGVIRLSIDDIFYTDYWRIKTRSRGNNLESYFNYDWHNQFIRLTFTRSLGNHRLRDVKPGSGSEEERGRVSN